MAQSFLAPAYPPMQPIPYTPIANDLIPVEWDSATELLTHLLLYPLDRERLLTEVRQRSLNRSQIFYVDHPLLQPKLLIISPTMTDGVFIGIITAAIHRIDYHTYMRHMRHELEVQYPSPPRPTISTSGSTSTLRPRTRTTMDGLADTCRHQ